MVSGSYVDPDGRLRFYGTAKAVPATGGDYLAYGDTRIMEFTVDLTTLTTSPIVQDYYTFFPAANTQLFVEQVVIDVEVGAVGGTSISVGTGYLAGAAPQTNPQTVTAISNTAFVNALVTASIDTAGKKIIMTNGSTSAGGYIGTTSADQTHKNFVTALAAGTFSAGRVKVRIFYRGMGVITQ